MKTPNLWIKDRIDKYSSKEFWIKTLTIIRQITLKEHYSWQKKSVFSFLAIFGLLLGCTIIYVVFFKFSLPSALQRFKTVLNEQFNWIARFLVDCRGSCSRSSSKRESFASIVPLGRSLSSRTVLGPCHALAQL